MKWKKRHVGYNLNMKIMTVVVPANTMYSPNTEEKKKKLDEVKLKQFKMAETHNLRNKVTGDVNC